MKDYDTLKDLNNKYNERLQQIKDSTIHIMKDYNR